MTNTTIPATQQQSATVNRPNYTSFEVPLFIVVLLAVVISKAKGGGNGASSTPIGYTQPETQQSEVYGAESTPTYTQSNNQTIGVNEMPEKSAVAPTNLVTELAQKLGRNIIYGVPGTGKDFFLSHLYREVKKIHGDKATIFMVDCKNEAKETGYFEGVIDPTRLYRKKVFASDPQDIFTWINDVLTDYDNFDAGTGFKILVINELAALNSKLSILPKNKKTGITPIKWWIDKVTGYGSSGDSAGISIFFASQNGHNEGIKLNGGDKSILTPFVIARDTEMASTNLILQANIIPQDDKISTQDMIRLCQKSPVGRCIYHGLLHKWLPMPELENFSGYNRDKREFKQRPGQTDALTDNERQSLNTRIDSTTATAPSQGDMMIQKLEATEAKSLETFITDDLKTPANKVEEVYRKILDLLAATDRMDLFTKFDD